MTTGYHPQSNGMVERAHHQLKDALRARLAGSAWPLHLPWVLLGLRATPKEDTGLSSADLVFGAPLTLPGGLLEVGESQPEAFMERLRVAPPSPVTRPLTYVQAVASVPQSLRQTALIYIRKGSTVAPLSPLYAGPYKVLNSTNKFFCMEVRGREEVVSVGWLNPHLRSSMLQPALQLLCGQPHGSAVRSSP
jgi:hypothetical protein